MSNFDHEYFLAIPIRLASLRISFGRFVFVIRVIFTGVFFLPFLLKYYILILSNV